MMRSITCAGPAWREVAAVPQGGYCHAGKSHLLNALLTTYEMPDSRVLVETLLPEWLGLERPFVQDSSDGRYLFFAEIDRALKALRGHFDIFCSPDLDSEVTTQAYPWLFRQLRCFRVGRAGPAVQHAKLWMFHWGGPEEFLEIVISSCNLTSDALKGQLQAGWRAKMPLEDSPSRERLRRWDVLPAFLDALARSSADDAKSVAKRWATLLARATPPDDAVFLASVPGCHSLTDLRSLPWGMAGLRHVVPSSWKKTEVDVLAPSIGLWKAESISRWASHAKATPDVVRVAWPPRNTASEYTDSMSLPLGTMKAFKKAGVAFVAWPPEVNEPWRSILHSEHQQTDARWPHCKLYWIGRHSRRETLLLVTSANLSNAAWGSWHRSKLLIANFEFGVAFPVTRRPLLKLTMMDGRPYIGGNLPDRSASPISWADACWDGRAIRLDLRLASHIRTSQIGVALILDGQTQQRVGSLKWSRIGRLHRAQFGWITRKGVPTAINLVIATKNPVTTAVPIADQRQIEAVLDTPCPEIPDEWLRDGEIRLILERFGGRVADAEGTPQRQAMPPDWPGDGKVAADYRVEVIEAARRNWRVIDSWQKAIDCVGTTDGSRRLLLRDGRKLRDHWLEVGHTRRPKADKAADVLAASLAAHELAFRMRRASE